LPNDSAAVGADIEVIPLTLNGLNFIPVAIAREEAVRNRRIPTNAFPSLFVSGFMGEEFLFVSPVIRLSYHGLLPRSKVTRLRSPPMPPLVTVAALFSLHFTIPQGRYYQPKTSALWDIFKISQERASKTTSLPMRPMPSFHGPRRLPAHPPLVYASVLDKEVDG
jgi:hypothetical protein